MKDSILTELLRSFTRQEIIQFEKFLLSPYFTEGKRIRSRLVLEYFYLLKKFYPGFAGKNFTKEFLFAKLYPGQKYKDEAMRKINSDLFLLAEKFLIQLELENGKIESVKYLLDQSSKRNLEKMFSKNFKLMQKHLKGLKKDEDYFYETFYLGKSYWSFYTGKMSFYKMKESVNYINNFFFYFLLVSLRIFLWGISFFRIVPGKNDLIMYDEVVDYVGRNIESLSHVPQVIIIYYLIMLVTKKEEQYFIKLNELKEKYFETLSEIDKLNLFIMMANYCHDMILSGETKFRRERFEIDKKYFIFLKKLKSRVHTFAILGSIKNANHLKEFKWVEKIISEFEYYSSIDDKPFAEQYVYADVCFFKGNYDEAIIHLSKAKTPYSNQKQYIKNLMLQIYFETGSFESALSLIDSSKHFLKNDKQLSPNTKLNSHNFIRFTEKLISLKQNKSEEGRVLLGKKVLETQELFNKEWLLMEIQKM